MNLLLRLKRYLQGLYFDLFIRTYQKDGMVFKVPRKLTSRVFRARFTTDTYETKEEYDFIDKYLSPDSRLLELGACIGVMSCYSNRKLSNPSQHVVVEANPLLIDTLKQNRDLNKCQFNIEQTIISKQQIVDFFLHDLIVGGSTVRRTGRKVEVPGTTIDELETKYAFRFNALIIDIEGGELQFLKENKPFITNLKVLFIEIHPFANILSSDEAKLCETILAELGFDKADSSQKNIYQVWIKST